MKTIRQKRLDRVICKWGEYEVCLYDEGDVEIRDAYWETVYFDKSEIPNLIKALNEIVKS